MASLEDRLRDLITNHLGVAPEIVNDEARFIEELRADSLDQVELVMAVEDEFQLQISDSDLELMRSVGDVKKYLETKVKA